jgi:UDP-N-acetyl-D-mannosaminuronic acid dehydrogenase
LSHTSHETRPLAVAIIGLGYIGLPTAAVAARAGLIVQGFDIDASVVETVNGGGVHIEEAGLEDLVREMVSTGRLSASTTLGPADVFVIAVPTPLSEGHRPDVGYVLAAAREIARVLAPGNLVVLESTSPIGTTEAVRDALAKLRPDLSSPCASGTDHDWCIAYCPERVIPGRTLVELVENDRSVGGVTPACAEAARDFYRQFVQGECSLTSARTAEMIKLVENSFRDVNIAFANELSLLADTFEIDVWEVIRLANRHPRVNILQPGPGVGGHCIAIDPWFLVAADPDNARLIRTAREVNDGKTQYVTAKALELSRARPDARVACLGLSFKPDIDDFRESPALAVATALASELGDRLSIVEPHVRALPLALAQAGARLSELAEALAECEVAVLLVDHHEFRAIAADALNGKSVYDTRGIW